MKKVWTTTNQISIQTEEADQQEEDLKQWTASPPLFIRQEQENVYKDRREPTNQPEISTDAYWWRWNSWRWRGVFFHAWRRPRMKNQTCVMNSTTRWWKSAILLTMSQWNGTNAFGETDGRNTMKKTVSGICTPRTNRNRGRLVYNDEFIVHENNTRQHEK